MTMPSGRWWPAEGPRAKIGDGTRPRPQPGEPPWIFATSPCFGKTAPGGNGNRCKAWKLNLQEKMSDRFGLEVTVCHYPPGCSKWNPVDLSLKERARQLAGTTQFPAHRGYRLHYNDRGERHQRLPRARGRV